MQLERYNGHIEDADFLSMLMVDIAGNIRSVSLPRGYVSEKVLSEGIGFDASNYGYAKVTNSDMVAVPDMDTAFYEIRGDYRILHVLCDVVSTEREPFGQYPRNVVRAARDFLREKGIADTAKVLVELEYYVFEETEYKTGVDQAFYRVKSAEGLGEGCDDKPRVGLHAASDGGSRHSREVSSSRGRRVAARDRARLYGYGARSGYGFAREVDYQAGRVRVGALRDLHAEASL